MFDSLLDIARALLDMDAEWNFPESVLQKQVITLQKKGEIPRSKRQGSWWTMART